MSSVEENCSGEEFEENLQCPADFIAHYQQIDSLSIERVCRILHRSNDVHPKIIHFIVECLMKKQANFIELINESHFREDLLPLIKRILSNSNDDEEILLSILRFFHLLLQQRSDLFKSNLTEWLPSVFHFLVHRLSSTSYLIYGQLLINLLEEIVEHFTPLAKEIVDVLGRSPSSIISTTFLNQLKTWIKHLDDTRLALFAIDLWQPLAALLSRLLTRGHTKGNEMLAVIQDAFIVANYSIRAAAFSAWAFFMSHIYRSEFQSNEKDLHQQQLYNRLLKLFLTPFLPDNTSKSKTASIAKCRAWLVLVSAYPTHINDVLLPFFSFAWKNVSTGSGECRQIGSEFLHETLLNETHGKILVQTAALQILPYLFDSIVDQLLSNEQSMCLRSWKIYLTYLMDSLKSLEEKERRDIYSCLLTRLEQCWMDTRLPSRSLFNLFEVFEQINFPLTFELISTDRQSSTLADQYLHLMLEHRHRLTDSNVEETYLHLIDYFIDTLSKTSDVNFAQQTSLLLKICCKEFSHQPSIVNNLFWQIWFRCSSHLINILLRTRSIDEHQSITMELLISPLSFTECSRLDYSFTFIWTQLFKGLCRLAQVDVHQSTDLLAEIYLQIFRAQSQWEQSISNDRHHRFFAFLLSMIKSLFKEFSIPSSKRSSIPCVKQFAALINEILQRVLSSDDNPIQWHLVCSCLYKSTKLFSTDQSKSQVFHYVRDLFIDLIQLCQTTSHMQIFFTQLTMLIRFFNYADQLNNPDHLILNKIFLMIQNTFDSSKASNLLEFISPLLIFTFQHQQTLIRNRARKCWNETFGRSTTLIYPEELKSYLRDLKDKEHFLLPNFLPTSTEESQCSQSIEIVTPLLSSSSTVPLPIPKEKPAVIKEEEDEIFDSPVLIDKRLPPMSNGLTESQKDKLRTPEPLPLLCDNEKNNPSIQPHMDTPTIESMMATFQLRNTSEEEIIEESNIAKKLRRSRRPSTSARKSLTNNCRKRRMIPSSEDLTETSNIVPSSVIEPTSSEESSINKGPVKSILKRLSPSSPRHPHTRRVAFHDQVKVLLFASPSRRDSNGNQQKKKSLERDELQSTSSMITRRSVALATNPNRTSKLFTLPPSTSQPTPVEPPVLLQPTKSSEPIFPTLIDCDKPLDSLIHVLYGGVCPTNAINYFRSIKMMTVGDIARSTVEQIEVYPIPPPKLANIQKALELYEERLVNSPSLSPIIANHQESILPIASGSEDTIAITDGTFTKESSAFPSVIVDPHHPSYDIDTMIDSLDYERLYLNDSAPPASTHQLDFIRTRRQKALANRDEYNSPEKRLRIDDDETVEETMDSGEYQTITSSQDSSLVGLTLAERLQKAAELAQLHGQLPFDDDYIELVRALLCNSSLTHLEQLHLKSLFLDN